MQIEHVDISSAQRGIAGGRVLIRRCYWDTKSHGNVVCVLCALLLLGFFFFALRAFLELSDCSFLVGLFCVWFVNKGGEGWVNCRVLRGFGACSIPAALNGTTPGWIRQLKPSMYRVVGSSQSIAWISLRNVNRPPSPG
jgi:hypothetical protein